MLSCRLVLLSFIISLPFSQWVHADSGYVGSEKCAECHAEKHADWSATGHHLMLRKSRQAEHANLELPSGYAWKDISYVVGGVRHKALFLDREGFIVTSSKEGKGIKSLYNLDAGTWEDYFPGVKLPYECAACHATGFNSKGHQDGLPGIVGAWEEDGIGCESCHGPGSTHIGHPYKRGIISEPTAEVCEGCHQRGGISNKPLREIGLELHHEQLDELKAGAHKGLSCLNCHNPHKKATEAKRNCTICHSRIYNTLLQDPHGKSGITCIDCHMPKVTKPAISNVSYAGDMRTHIFKINVEPKAEMFEIIEEKGQQSLFFKGYVTLDFVCLDCHGTRDKEWAVENAKDFHDKFTSKTNN